MRICIIGKFPPIQGGVSMRTYWTAHGLAARGHEVHVITNAKEATPPFRMFMRPQDWARCEVASDDGSVTVHWTDPVDRSQSYIPMASPFVTKLAATAARAHSQRSFDIIYSHYLEPYGVAGLLASQMIGLPHVVRLAGSDAGRLWHHPQFELLYDHVLRSAEAVVAVGAVAARAIQRGVSPERIVPGGDFLVPEQLFTPKGPKLDIAALRAEAMAQPAFNDLIWGGIAADRPYFGTYGKLGGPKGSFALLAAMHRLMLAGLEVGLVVLAHGGPIVQRDFRARVEQLGLLDRVLQIPFLPHWRVPEFLRSCLAVCCLEQDFQIRFHTPLIPREVLLCGTCLVGSTEVIRKLPSHGRLPDRYGCVAIKDVNDVEVLSDRLAAILRDRETAVAIGARGRAFARDLQRDIRFPQSLEHILQCAAARQRAPFSTAHRGSEEAPGQDGPDRFPLTRLVAAAMPKATRNRCDELTVVPPGRSADLLWAHQVLETAERGIEDGEIGFRPLAAAVRIEIAIATTEDEADTAHFTGSPDPLFRLHLKSWAMQEGTLAGLFPVREPHLRVIEFDCDVSKFLGAQSVAAFPVITAPGPSYIVAFGRSVDRRQEPLFIDELTARILQLSNGTRTVSEIAETLSQWAKTATIKDRVRWIEELFLLELISLRDTPVGYIIEAPQYSVRIGT